ncbi:MAG: type IV pilus twitching motility protein PilT [Kiritimatiellae bacterium]|nr:type IV pilus twitching motility protein PilT [Kiritimatiellia bacterium]MDD4341910.1 type IV pilus twitching motility protein PilT [Kiritimatiellia bacterium]
MSTLKSSEIQMEDLLELAVQESASDLHLAVGLPPILRIHGALAPLDADPLKPEDTDRLMRSITPAHHLEAFETVHGADFGFGHKDVARFRVSIFRQKGHVGVVLRQIPTKILTLEDIGLPPQTRDLLFKPRGLILVTGPTGSGKTTTLASMLNIINMERDCHIITVEDPIEYFHGHQKSVVTQREVGVDVPTFKEALRRALRQDPDVILVGEMRDLETMEAALTAAETGHLVFATLHTTGAARTVDRIVDAFPTNQQEQVRMQLSTSIVAVISQCLMPRKDKAGRIAAFEIMIATSSIRSLIRDNKTFRITSDLQTGAKWGMQTLDSHLLDLWREGKIAYEELVTKAQDTEEVMQQIRGKQ